LNKSPVKRPKAKVRLLGKVKISYLKALIRMTLKDLRHTEQI
jgi:hypothetical protein